MSNCYFQKINLVSLKKNNVIHFFTFGNINIIAKPLRDSNYTIARNYSGSGEG